MGYTTEFEGQFDLNKPLEKKHRDYLVRFSETRRMQRDEKQVAKLPDPIREAVGLPIGVQGKFYVGDVNRFGQSRTPDIVNFNAPPLTQPSLWCRWAPNKSGTAIQWNEGEKFYAYIEWLTYIVETFLKPWGYVLNGKVLWHGEEPGDVGRIVVENNEIMVSRGTYLRKKAVNESNN